MHELLMGFPDIVNRLFDVLELIVVRATLLGLVVIGALALLHKHSAR